MTHRHAVLAHELGGSVASLRAIAQVLADGGPEVWPNLPDVLHDEADRLAMLVDDTRAARPGTRWNGSPRRTCDLPAILAAARGYASRLQPDRPITLDPGIVDEPFVGQPQRVDRVLRNLLDNALKYTPTGTPIRLRLRTVPGSLEVSVIDHGPGLSPEDRDRIFLPGVRAASSIDAAGSGLGLALCRSTVTGWGGRIWIAETPGGGATFSFTIPCPARPAAGTVSPTR